MPLSFRAFMSMLCHARYVDVLCHAHRFIFTRCRLFRCYFCFDFCATHAIFAMQILMLLRRAAARLFYASMLIYFMPFIF